MYIGETFKHIKVIGTIRQSHVYTNIPKLAFTAE